RALPGEVVHPAQLPDGVLEATLEGEERPVRLVVEIATYPERRGPRLGLGGAPTGVVATAGAAPAPARGVGTRGPGRGAAPGGWGRGGRGGAGSSGRRSGSPGASSACGSGGRRTCWPSATLAVCRGRRWRVSRARPSRSCVPAANGSTPPRRARNRRTSSPSA